MLEANVPAGKKITLYKKGTDGRFKENEVTKADWQSAKGYEVNITSKQQRLIEVTDEIQRLKVVQQEYPNNQALRKATQKRMIGLVDLTPQEINEIEEEEAKNIEQMVQGFAEQPQQGAPGQQISQIQELTAQPQQ